MALIMLHTPCGDHTLQIRTLPPGTTVAAAVDWCGQALTPGTWTVVETLVAGMAMIGIHCLDQHDDAMVLVAWGDQS
jgi:hypothetical protein